MITTEDRQMKLSIDNVWTSPTMLHVRVTTWGDDGQRWRKYHAATPLDTVEPDAIKALVAYAQGQEHLPSVHDVPLF